MAVRVRHRQARAGRGDRWRGGEIPAGDGSARVAAAGHSRERRRRGPADAARRVGAHRGGFRRGGVCAGAVCVVAEQRGWGVDQVTGLVPVVHEDSGAREYDPEIGRWVERDPIGFAGGTTGLYEYCYGAPVGMVDVSGAKPFDEYLTPIDAGYHALLDVNHLSIAENLEYAGVILRLPNGAYTYSPPVKGKVDQVNPADAYTDECAKRSFFIVGTYHTHGENSHGRYRDEEFSIKPRGEPSDYASLLEFRRSAIEARGGARRAGQFLVWSFLGTPGGRFGMWSMEAGAPAGSAGIAMGPVYLEGSL
jgi:RHS repeat-associated protein